MVLRSDHGGHRAPRSRSYWAATRSSMLRLIYIRCFTSEAWCSESSEPRAIIAVATRSSVSDVIGGQRPRSETEVRWVYSPAGLTVVMNCPGKKSHPYPNGSASVSPTRMGGQYVRNMAVNLYICELEGRRTEERAELVLRRARRRVFKSGVP